MISSSQQLLIEGLQKLGLDIPMLQQGKMLRHLEILTKWNQKHSLTAITEPREMLVKHVLDSMAILDHISGDRILDFGSGPGFPGITLAIANSDTNFTLLDVNKKKCQFLQYVINELNLPNASVVQCNIHDYYEKELFAGVVSRAVGNVDDFYSSIMRLLRPLGCLYLMLGKAIDIPAYTKEPGKLIKLSVPFMEGSRHLLQIRKHD